MPIVKIEHLDQFSKDAHGPSSFGVLMRYLLWARFGKDIKKHSFLALSANNLRGFDGEVLFQNNEKSVWELSTKEHALEKIQEDLKSSFDKPLPSGWHPSETVYTACTLRKLQDKIALKEKLQKINNGFWHDIHIVDAVTIEQWIEQCPAVEAWCAYTLGIGNGRFGRSLGQYWHEWSFSTAPAMSEALVLAGRRKEDFPIAAESISANAITLLVDEPAEGVAYIWAGTNEFLDEETKTAVLSTALVIDDPKLAQLYSREPQPGNLIPVTVLISPANIAANVLKQAGHFVICIVGRAELTYDDYRLIKRALPVELEDALRSTMCIPTEQARVEARGAGGSVTAWAALNKLESSAYGSQSPLWLAEPYQSTAIAAVLCDAWNENCPSDVQILKSLSGKSHEQLSRELSALLRQNTPLLAKENGHYYVVAPKVAILLATPFFTQASLDLYQKALERAFVSDFPNIEWETISGGELVVRPETPYSELLMRGLADMLAKLSDVEKKLEGRATIIPFPYGSDFINATLAPIVRRMTSPDYIISLERYLPYFIEAAPDMCLDAIKSCLCSTEISVKNSWEDLVKKNNSANPFIFSTLISAIRDIGCTSEHFSDAVYILLRLSEKGVAEGHLATPLNAICAMFFEWSLETSASLDERVDVLSTFAELFPREIWEVLKGIHKPFTAVAINRSGWRVRERRTISDREAMTASERYSEIALQLTEKSFIRQLEYLAFYARLSPRIRDELVNQIADVEKNENLDGRIRHQFSAVLRRTSDYVKNQCIADDIEIDQLQNLAHRFSQNGELTQLLTLLNEAAADNLYRNKNLDEAIASLNSQRDVALRILIQKNGLKYILKIEVKGHAWVRFTESVHRTLTTSESMKLIAFLCKIENSSVDQLTLIGQLSKRMAQFEGGKWFNRIKRMAKRFHWKNSSTAACLSTLPFTAELKEILTSDQAIDGYYWSLRSPVIVDDDDDKDCLAIGLANHGRARDYARRRLFPLNPGTEMYVLVALLNEVAGHSHIEARPNIDLFVKETFILLNEVSDIDLAQVVALEMRALYVLPDICMEPLLSHRLICESPQFFINLIRHLYHVASPDEDNNFPNEQRNQKRIAKRIFDSWRATPGLDKTSCLNEEVLRKWISSVRELVLHEEIKKHADFMIGSMLANLPKDATTLHWPSDFLCGLLEELHSDEIDDGIMYGILNYEAVRAVQLALDDTKKKELPLKWEDMARGLSLRWPRAKRLCKKISEALKQTAATHQSFNTFMRLRWHR